MELIRYYTPREVKQLLRISSGKFHQLCSQGELPSIRLGTAGHYRVSEESLQKFLTQNLTKKEV